MSFLEKLFAPREAKAEPAAVQPAVPCDIKLVANKQYRLTRQMYLFPEQAVHPDVTDYLLIGAVVTYLESGETFEDNRLIAPWVRVRSAKGKEGWGFAHYLTPASEEDIAKAQKKRMAPALGRDEHWVSAATAITIWNGNEQ